MMRKSKKNKKISVGIIGYFELKDACAGVPFHPFLQK